MKNWGNWSYQELKEVIDKAKTKGEASISISQEHTDYQNDQQVKSWLTDMGLKFKSEMERTVIHLK